MGKYHTFAENRCEVAVCSGCEVSEKGTPAPYYIVSFPLYSLPIPLLLKDKQHASNSYYGAHGPHRVLYVSFTVLQHTPAEVPHHRSPKQIHTSET